MLSDESVQVVGSPNGPLRCDLCLQDTPVIDITILMKKKGRGPFYPLCRDCSSRILEAAALTLTAENMGISL